MMPETDDSVYVLRAVWEWNLARVPHLTFSELTTEEQSAILRRAARIKQECTENG
jgi:hypothetical protein